jgi:hypothetical protein
MNVNTRPALKPLPSPQSAAPKAEPKEATFNYNPQDPKALDSDTATLSVRAENGSVETDKVVLDNKKGIFIFGRLIALRDDPKYKMEPNADGNFVFPREHAKFTGANAFSAAAKTVDKYNEVYKELTGKSVEWAFGDQQLLISPETGEWPNAFYAREMKGVHFFDVKDTSTGNSGEVASHEVGHAVLDAVRPNYLTGSGPETGAFHEAFGDVLAMLMTLGNESAVDKIVAQTEGGDLSSKYNVLSDMGEDFGNVLGMGDRGIRSSFNNFTYKDPATLPERGSETELGHEIHDFSRLWSGAFYDVIDAIADSNRAEGMSPKEALMAAGEEGWKLLIGQMENSSSGSETTFKNMAANLVAGDAQFNGGKRQEAITDIMVKRELLPEGSGLFKSSSLAFSGDVVAKEHTLGSDFGLLAGVKMETLVDQPAFGGITEFETAAMTSEAQKGVKMMMANDEILFSDGKPGFDQLFKADGTAYKAYVTTGADGQRELHRVPLAVCDFSGHDHGGHDHGHIHGEGHQH